MSCDFEKTQLLNSGAHVERGRLLLPLLTAWVPEFTCLLERERAIFEGVLDRSQAARIWKYRQALQPVMTARSPVMLCELHTGNGKAFTKLNEEWGLLPAFKGIFRLLLPKSSLIGSQQTSSESSL